MKIKASHYDVILAPVITEKSTLASQQNQVIFNVSRKATKLQIKDAVQSLFGVKVEAVNTLVRKGKRKRFRGHLGRRSDIKRAIVSLEDASSFDVTSGI